MGFMHIENLYKNQNILQHEECYALEKVHGTSAHIAYRPDDPDNVIFFSGGESHDKFVGLFDKEALLSRFLDMPIEFGGKPVVKITVYGEAYGGKQQGMSKTYGPTLHFIVFDVMVEVPTTDQTRPGGTDESWFPAPMAEAVAGTLGIEFVPYVRIPARLEHLDRERDRPSVVAERRGMGTGKKREGVVLRPIVESLDRFGRRVISKHKGAEFNERATEQKVVDPEKLVVLQQADAIANEWVVLHRLEHVLSKFPDGGVEIGMERTKDVINAMTEDIEREAVGEIVPTKESKTAIGRNTAIMFKKLLNDRMRKAVSDKQDAEEAAHLFAVAEHLVDLEKAEAEAKAESVTP